MLRTDQWTDQRTNRPTDRPSYRDAWTHLKMKGRKRERKKENKNICFSYLSNTGAPVHLLSFFERARGNLVGAFGAPWTNRLLYEKKKTIEKVSSHGALDLEGPLWGPVGGPVGAARRGPEGEACRGGRRSP